MHDSGESKQRLPGEKHSDEITKPVSPQQTPTPWWHYVLWLIAIFLFTWFWFGLGQPQQQVLSYTQFKDKVRDNQVASVTLQGDKVIGRYRQAHKTSGNNKNNSSNKNKEQSSSKPETTASSDNPGKAAEATEQPETFTTTLPPIDDSQLMTLLDEHDVDVNAKPEQANWLMWGLISLLPWVLIIGVMWYAGRKMQERMAVSGGAGSSSIFGFAKSKARRVRKGTSSKTFDDVAGLENAKRDMKEITGYLREPERYRKLGADIPKGVLLMGAPGTGKTLLAKAVAGEAEVPFFSISGSEFIEMFVGVGASRVRDMFERAKKEAPAIIFIDEIDSVGRARGTGVGGGHDEREQTLNQILGEMDGFEPHEAVVVMAATNRPDVLDPALLRPGRFDRKVTLDLPDKKARKAILEIHSKGVPLAGDVDLDRLAALTVGFAGADLENLINEAALLSGQENKTSVNMDSLLNARDKVVLGGKREMIVGDNEKKLIAFHESGHVLVGSLLPHTDPLDKVTITPRGRALGATEQIPEEERHNLPKSYLHDRIGVMLGGRASEQLIFGEVSSGAEEDLKQATRLARYMVTRWGMSDTLGPVAFSRGEDHVFLGKEMTQPRDFSEHTARIIDDEICRLVHGVEKEITDLLSEHRPQLQALANELLEKETLHAGEITAILESSKPAQHPRAATHN